MNLSEEQLQRIHSYVRKKIDFQSLQADVVDHLCCAVEHKIENGKSFEEAVRDAITELAPHGLDNIQQETIDLLTNQTTTYMRKIMYAIGLATTMSMAMGLMLKLLHMPGGEQLINYGFLSFSLLFLPMLAVSHYNSSKGRSISSHEKLKMLFGYLSAVVTGLAIFYKMQMQLDISAVLFMTGTSIFSFGFLPFLFFGMYKKSLQVTNTEL
jgi:Na+(H+)/acetate symporter ActP